MCPFVIIECLDVMDTSSISGWYLFYYNRTYQVYTKIYEAVAAAAVTAALSIRGMYRMRGSRGGSGGPDPYP